MCEIHTAKKKPAGGGGLKLSGERRRNSFEQRCLSVDRSAANLVVLQHTVRIADYELGHWLAKLVHDLNGPICVRGTGRQQHYD
jgi:hypothetical protein